MNASTAATSRAVPRHATGNARGRYGPILAADQPARRATQQTHGFQFVPATYWPVVRLEVQPPGIAQSFQGNQRDFALLCSFRARGGPGLNA